MSLESQDATRRRHSGESLLSTYSSFDRPSTEGDNYHRRNHSGPEGSMAAPSPISPTSTFGPPISSFGSKFSASNGTSQNYATPPESRKNSEEVKNQRQSLPSLLEVGLVPPGPSSMTLHSGAPTSFPHSNQPPSSSHYASGHPSLPPPLSSLDQPRYYDGARSGYSNTHGSTPAPFSAEAPRPPTYTPAAPYAAHPPPHSGQVAYAHAPPPPAPYQFTHGHPGPNAPSHALPSYPTPSGYAPAGVASQYPYHQESTNTNAPAYTPTGSPPSKVLGKRPAPGYGNAIERALQVSSMRRDLENSRTHSYNIYQLVERLYNSNGAATEFQGQGLEYVLGEFQKAVREAEELREGLEGCRRLLTDMCKEQELNTIPEKGRPHIQEYDAEEHHYLTEAASMGAPQQPEMKKMRRGRAAPPGRCHSCHRAETPEWRRGPDGARTLCNACGLHYAKLTRKMSKSGLSATTIARKSPNTTMA